MLAPRYPGRSPFTRLRFVWFYVEYTFAGTPRRSSSILSVAELLNSRTPMGSLLAPFQLSQALAALRLKNWIRKNWYFTGEGRTGTCESRSRCFGGALCAPLLFL